MIQRRRVSLTEREIIKKLSLSYYHVRMSLPEEARMKVLSHYRKCKEPGVEFLPGRKSPEKQSTAAILVVHSRSQEKREAFNPRGFLPTMSLCLSHTVLEGKTMSSRR